MKNSDNRNAYYLPAVESALMFILLFIKLFRIDSKMEYGGLSLTVSLMTVIAAMAVYLIISLIKKKIPVTFVYVFYYIMSAVIFIDILYFSYFSKLPSVASLSSAKYLGGVTESIKNLMTPYTLSYIIDLPLIFIYLLNFRTPFMNKTGVTDEDGLHRINITVSSTLLTLCVILSVISGIQYDFKARYVKNELICYHISDIVSVCLNVGNDFEISDSDYVSVNSRQQNTDDTGSESSTEDKEPVVTLIDEYDGLAAGRNVITIQVEALQAFVIGMEIEGQEITPNLNALMNNDTVYFENYYYIVGGGNTADAEFSINNSLYSPDTEAAYVKYCDNTYHGLPYILKENGYSGAYAFHAYTGSYWNREAAYVNQGFDDFYSREDLIQDEIVGMGISDRSFFKQATEIMKTYEQPFYSFLITLSSHYPYEIPHSLHELTLPGNLNGTYVGNYLQTIHYVDSCIGSFIEYLKEAELYDNSVITIYGDHFGVLNDTENNRVMTGLLGAYYEDVLFRVPMMIHIPNCGLIRKISTVASHVDYLPTFLHLIGLENEDTIMFGNDIFLTPDNIIYEQMHVSRGSFVTNDIFFVYPKNGIYQNTKVFDKNNNGKVLPLEDGYDEIAQNAIETYNKCMYVLDNDIVTIKNNTEN